MKHIFTFSIIVSTLLISLTAISQIPNHSFEDWTNNGNYSTPSNWDTPNDELSFMNIFTVTESTDAYDGQKSMKMESGNLFGIVIPGVATLGEITINITTQEATVSGGIPYTERPARLKGFYKYAPQTADSCAIITVFYKYNTSTGERDTIGLGIFASGVTTSNWTEFSANIDWYTSDTPDTTNIVILSTASTFVTSGGSTLLVDNLSYDFSVGMPDDYLSDEDINIYPIPANSYINIEFDHPPLRGTNFEVYNLTGSRVLEIPLTHSFQQIPLNTLPEGIHLYRITESNKMIKNGKLIIEK